MIRPSLSYSDIPSVSNVANSIAAEKYASPLWRGEGRPDAGLPESCHHCLLNINETEGYPTFLHCRVFPSSLTFVSTYLIPATWMPFEYRPSVSPARPVTISLISSGLICYKASATCFAGKRMFWCMGDSMDSIEEGEYKGRTSKPSLFAQTLSPAALTRAPLSTCPLPTRLFIHRQPYSYVSWYRGLSEKTYLESTYAIVHESA